MKKLLIVSCVLFLVGAAAAEQLLYSIQDFTGGGSTHLRLYDATSWGSDMKAVGVGDLYSTVDWKACYWTPSGGLQELTKKSGTLWNVAVGIADDGTTIVGYGSIDTTSNVGNRAMQYYTTQAATRLDSTTITRASVSRIAGNGTKSIGNHYNTAATGVIWDMAGNVSSITGTTGMTGISTNASYIIGNAASQGKVSRDGGATFTTLSGPNARSAQALNVNDDGTVVYGYENTTTKYTYGTKTAYTTAPVKWTYSGGTWTASASNLGNGGLSNVVGYDIRPGDTDLSIMAGNIITVDAGKNLQYTPGVWDTATGTFTPLTSLISQYAQDNWIPSGYFFYQTYGMSNDGTTIFGYLTDNTANGTTGNWMGFVAKVPEPATIALLGLGGLALIRRKRQ